MKGSHEVLDDSGRVGWVSEGSTTFIGYLLLRKHVLSNFHFNKISDGVFCEGFRIT